MKIILAMATVGAAALMVLGGAMPAEASGPYSISGSIRAYFEAVIDILEYEVDEYNDFNLIRMNVSIENLESNPVSSIRFSLGGDVSTIYHHDSYEEVRGRGGNVSVEDCTSKGRFGQLPPGSTVETTVCIMMDKMFEPDALMVRVNEHAVNNLDTDWTSATDDQVVPFHTESTFCFVNLHEHCNANNIQRVDGTPAPQPEPEPEPPATLLYTIYNNHTGTLTMVFDKLVVASNPDRIHLIHDIDAFIEDGTAPNLGDAELNTVDDKRQSAMLAFTLSDTLRLEVIQSLQDSADLALSIETRAIYAAEGFVPVEPILIPDITVIR